MSKTMNNLWPTASISIDVLTPIAIMRAQAQYLNKITQGMLEAEVVTNTSKIVTQESTETNAIEHYFEVVVPALSDYRVRVIKVRQTDEDAYPCTVRGVGINANVLTALDQKRFDVATEYRTASTEEEFVKALTESLKSKEMIGLIQSLIARVNETRLAEDSDSVGTMSEEV